MHSGPIHNAMYIYMCVRVFVLPDLQLQFLFPKEEPLSSSWGNLQPTEQVTGTVFPTSACIQLPLPSPEAEDADKGLRGVGSLF